MKIAFVNSSFHDPHSKNTRNIMMAEALCAHNIEAIFYSPVTTKTAPIVRREGKNQILSIFVSCWVPFFSKYRKTLENKSIFFRRMIYFMEYLTYVIRIHRRLKYDNVDAYVFLHLWDSTLSLVSSVLSCFRPVAVLWMGHSLRWLKRFKWQYPLILIAYKLALRKVHVLINDDIEQKYCLFKILKVKKSNVHIFNPCIVDQKVFRPMNKIKCARKVKFNTKFINLLSLSRIPSSISLAKARNWDYDKNIFLLIEMFREVKEKNPNVFLHVVGDGPGMNELKLKIQEYSLQDRVKLHGWISPTNDDDDLRPYFINAADLVICPSCLTEFNVETALFEALMCGKPVMAFKRYKWVDTEHLGGFLVDIDPKIAAEQVLERLNYDYLNKKSKEARKVPIKHNVPKYMWGKKLKRIILQILNREQTFCH